MVGKGRKIYVHFKNKNKPLNVATARHRLEEIYENADLYRHIVSPVERPHPDVDIRYHLIAISNTRMDSCTPFLLDLLRTYRSNVINKEKTVRLLNELTTLLVRRKMTERPTTVYDTMFPRLFSMIAGEPDPVRAMQEQFRKNNVWVSDQEFKESLVERTLYRTRDLIFTRMVLMEIDRTMQTHGQYPDYSTVETIEHVIPQTLDGHWKEYLGADCDNSKFETIINSLGNLCLLSGPANSSASQNPFRAKAIQYSEVTALARELKHYEGDWNLAAVRARSERLADKALVRWAWTL